MRKRQWILLIIILIAFAIFWDYAQYNTDIRTLSIMSEWAEEELRERIPYKPFIGQFDPFTEYLLLPW